MGRGRAKAKQTKKARELKYSSPTMDFEALQRELSSYPDDGERPDEDYYDDPYDEEIDDEYRR